MGLASTRQSTYTQGPQDLIIPAFWRDFICPAVHAVWVQLRELSSFAFHALRQMLVSLCFGHIPDAV